MFAAGIDVGTTNLEVFLVDLEACRIRERRSAPNRRLPSDDGLAYFQDPAGIVAAIREMLGSLTEPVASIGVTGQVHGILYADGAGKPLSPLYCWLDRHGTEPVGATTVQGLLFEKTGALLPVGYGLLTHYANRLFNRIPPGARRVLGINELVAGALLGRPLDRADSSDLACFGAFDPVTKTHDPQVLKEILGPGEIGFPGLARPFSVAGTDSRGTPVAYPVGDNQAGFFGLIARPAESCLVGIGTSGQLSVFSPEDPGETGLSVPNLPSVPEASGLELRPYLGLGYLHVGASLCAGKSWEVLARLFAELIARHGSAPAFRAEPDEGIFRLMTEAARESAVPGSSPLIVDTALNGTRRNPERRGSISGIDMDNLTVGNLVRGTVDGIVRELADFRPSLGPLFDPLRSVVVSGSVVRKNELFRESLERQFRLPVRIPPFDGGAALGAALIGAVSGGVISLEDGAGIIDGLWAAPREPAEA